MGTVLGIHLGLVINTNRKNIIYFRIKLIASLYQKIHSKLLTDKAVGWKLDSGLPGQHCPLSERSCRTAPPTSSYSKAHIPVTAQVLKKHRFKKAAKNRSSTLTYILSFTNTVRNAHPNISTLIDDAVALYIEEFRGPVGNSASLGCPILYCHGCFTSSNLKNSQRLEERRCEHLNRSQL